MSVIKEVLLNPIKPEDIPRTSQIYAEVFAGNPWYEISKCNNCGQFGSNSPEEKTSCSHCESGTLSLPAYPKDSTKKYIFEELSKPDAVGLLAIYLNSANDNEQLAGFGWGYRMTDKEFVSEKYSSEEMGETILELLINSSIFYYISEVGVIETLQGQGIGKKLTHRLMDHGQNSQGIILLRTNESSSMRYIAEKFGMIPIVGLDSGIKDAENEERVIFVNKNNE